MSRSFPSPNPQWMEEEELWEESAEPTAPAAIWDKERNSQIAPLFYKVKRIKLHKLFHKITQYQYTVYI